MNDYIKREDAIQTLVGITTYNNAEEIQDACFDSYAKANGWLGGVRDSISALEEGIPVTDVRPVVRGKWKPRDLTYGRSYYFCSACEETVDMPTAMGIPMFRYCPNCEADLRGADE